MLFAVVQQYLLCSQIGRKQIHLLTVMRTGFDVGGTDQGSKPVLSLLLFKL